MGKALDQKIRVSLIIPTVNQVEPVKKCLDSLYGTLATFKDSFEVIIVDDGSSRELQKQLKEALSPYPVSLITKRENEGFSRTVNIGGAAGRGDYLCLVNNDIVFFQRNWLDLMLKEVKKPGVGVVGARLLYPDGRIQHGGIYYLPKSRSFDHEYRYKPGNYPPALKSREVLGVTGALMLIDRLLWKKLGGMDEQYFIALEDVDFSLRTWAEGRKVVYAGEVVAFHHEGLTRGNNFSNKNPFWLEKEMEGMKKFFRKWQGKLSSLSIMERTGSRSENLSLSQWQAKQWEKKFNRETVIKAFNLG